jgi:hypothetical protein
MEPETQGPFYLIQDVIIRRNGIQYGTKTVKKYPRKIKKAAA